MTFSLKKQSKITGHYLPLGLIKWVWAAVWWLSQWEIIRENAAVWRIIDALLQASFLHASYNGDQGLHILYTSTDWSLDTHLCHHHCRVLLLTLWHFCCWTLSCIDLQYLSIWWFIVGGDGIGVILPLVKLFMRALAHIVHMLGVAQISIPQLSSIILKVDVSVSAPPHFGCGLSDFWHSDSLCRLSH